MKPMYLVLGIASIGVLLLVVILTRTTPTDDGTPAPVAEGAQNDSRNTDTTIVSDTTLPEALTPPVVPPAVESVTEELRVGSYKEYSPETFSRATEAGTTVLFFKATWCPSCKALDAGIQAEASAIPEGVTILATDYDTYTDLRREYGVTTQHTLVQVAPDGTLIKKWAGGVTLASVLDEII